MRKGLGLSLLLLVMGLASAAWLLIPSQGDGVCEPSASMEESSPSGPATTALRTLAMEPGEVRRLDLAEAEPAGGTAHVELRLPARFVLEVRTIDGAPLRSPTDRTDDAVPDAAVWLVGPDEDQGEPVAACRTDADGVGLLRDVPAGRWLLNVQANGFAAYREALAFAVDGLAADARPKHGQHVIRLSRPGPRVAGVVTDARERPLPGVLVCLAARDGSRAPRFGRAIADQADPFAPGQPLHTLTDAQGRFSLETLAGYPEQLLIVCPGHPRLPAVVTAALDAALLAAIAPRASVPGCKVVGEPAVRSSYPDLTICVPDAFNVEVRFERGEGEQWDGRVRVSDGRVDLGLVGDPLVGRIPGVARWSTVQAGPGSLSLSLVPGGYQAFYETASGAPTACYFTVKADEGRAANGQPLLINLRAER